MLETPLDALQWLKQKAKRVRIGKDDYTDIANVIRALIQERKDLQIKIHKLENPPKPKPKSRVKEKRPFGTEGNGEMDFNILT